MTFFDPIVQLIMYLLNWNTLRTLVILLSLMLSQTLGQQLEIRKLINLVELL